MPEAPRSDGKTFFGFRLYLAGRCRENLQSARGSVQCKSSPGNNMIRSNHLFYHFSITIHFYLASFHATKYFQKKNLAGENVHWTTYWVWIAGPEPLVVNVLLQLVVFKAKQKSFRQIFEWIIIFCKNIARDNVPYFPLPGPNHLQHLFKKCINLNVFWLKLYVGELSNLKLSIGFQMLKH